ncbi:MAG: hypothetical protein H6809_02115 [Phycisphaeraceae bacterium]|nr:hypothetical protein [Phycisphaeraceae bacterium]
MRSALGLVLCAGLSVGLLVGCVSVRDDLEDRAIPHAAMARHLARTGPSGDVPLGAIWNAKLRRDEMAALAGAGGAGGLQDGPLVEWVGPGNVGGRIRSILIHPTTPSTMWVGGVTGGVWRTVDAGATWEALDDFVPSLTISCMAMDPNDPDVLYAGTGEGFFETIEGTSNTAAPPGAGVFRSGDGGQTWSALGSTSGAAWRWVNRLVFAPGSSTVMLAATSAGLFRSADAGATWTQTASGQYFDVRFHPTDPARAVAGGHEVTPRYSLDGGQTWQASTGASGHRTELAYAPSDPQIVYAAVADHSNRLRVHRSTDGGQTYVLQTSGSGISTLGAYTGVIWVDPLNASTILMGGQQMYRSINAGVTLSQTFNGVHADHHIIVNHPQYDGTTNRTIFFGCDGGIYRSTDSGGSAVTALNNNLGITQFYGAAAHPTSGVVIGGTQDNGTKRYAGSINGWTSPIGGDGGFCASDPTDPNVWYGETQRLAIRRSTNGGTSFSQITTGLTDVGGQNTNFIPYFMLDPNDPNRMLAAARRLWRANDVRTGSPPTWTIIKPSIEAPEPPAGPPQRDPSPDHYVGNSPFNISTIAVAKGNPDVVWVGYNNGQLDFSTDGTAATPTWTRVDTNGVGLPDRWVSRIVIDPANHARVYVALLGYTGSNVWLTTDSGQTWQDITGDLPQVPVAALALSECPPRLFAGTDIGLFESVDDGATWTPTLPGVGMAPVEELVWRDASTLLIATHGRGIYLGHMPAFVCVPDLTTGAVPGTPGYGVPNCVLNNEDFFYYLAQFAAGNVAVCDLTTGAVPGQPGFGVPNGVLSNDDFFYYLTIFAAGC